jgi:hypothetical protein
MVAAIERADRGASKNTHTCQNMQFGTCVIWIRLAQSKLEHRLGKPVLAYGNAAIIKGD